MLSTKKGIVLALCLGFAQAGAVIAEPSYLIYPANVPTVFRYDTGRYDLIGTGQDKFDPQYAVGNYMRWDRIANRVPVEVYGAPQLLGFEPTAGPSEYLVYTDNFDVVVDGYGPSPRTIGNLCFRFWPYVTNGAAVFNIDGTETMQLTVPMGSLEVSQLLDDGYYGGKTTHHVSWTGAQALELVAFSDKDGDLGYRGTPLFRIVSRLAPVAVESTSWGRVKSLYR